MSVDYKWMSQGGILLGGDGDLAFTSSAWETMSDVARSRLKAAVDGYKNYLIGAGLTEVLGQAPTPEMQIALRRRAVASLTNDFAPNLPFHRASDLVNRYVVAARQCSITTGDHCRKCAVTRCWRGLE